jgi:hypothetical protein
MVASGIVGDNNYQHFSGLLKETLSLVNHAQFG